MRPPLFMGVVGMLALGAGLGCGKVTPDAPVDGSGGAVGSGGSSSGGTSGSGGAGGGTDAGTGTGGSAGSARCPAREPTAGTACLRDGAVCEYGTDPRGDVCRVFATCSGARWSVAKSDTATCPPFTDAGMCAKGAAGTACTANDAYCSLTDGRSCHCTNCVDGPVQHCGTEYLWRCQAMNTTTGCPSGAPDIGTACVVDGVNCGYGCGMKTRQCDKGVWVAAGEGPCPISTRLAKRDIRYLTAAQIRALARQILDVKLATYEYRDSPLAGRPHLGFVIEDSPEIPAVDRDHDMVDLYGYTSMLLAASQRQRDEIRQLRRQVAALKVKAAIDAKDNPRPAAAPP